MFFVISGFLISGIILKALSRDTFSFIDFYARRIRRIFPALTLVLLATWALGWLKLLPDEFTSLTKHIAAGSVYASNLLLYKEAGYFDPSAELKPLLHLWSLGVEEQFYIVWPLLLFVTYRWRRVQLPAMIGLACASFAFNLATVRTHPEMAFYMPHARLWELALGGILAHLQLTSPRLPPPAARGATSARYGNLAAVTGLALLCVSFVALRSQQLFPGWFALAPVLGTLLLIAAGERAWINQHLLSLRPVVFIGLISYPLYLWHWPLLSITHIVESGHLYRSAVICAVAAAFLLAVLTYRYLEIPIRRLQSLPRTALALFVCMGIVGAFGYVAFRYREEPLSARYGVDSFVAARAEHAFDGSHLRRADGLRIQPGVPRTVLFLGDSNVEQYYPRVDELLTRDPQHSNTVVFATDGGCPPLPGVSEAHHAYCNGLIERAISYADSPAVDTIIIGAAWQSYFYDPDPRYRYRFSDQHFHGDLTPESESARRALQSFEAMVRAFVAHHKRVFIVLQIPVGPELDPRRMIKRGMTTIGFKIQPRPVRSSVARAAVARINSKLMAIARRDGAMIIDPLETLCGPVTCATLDKEGHPMYRDAGHLRPSYVRKSVHFLDSIVSPDVPASQAFATPPM